MINENNFRDRIVLEKEELDEKLKKLRTFLKSEMLKHLPENDQELLIEQHDVMESYSYILNKRLKNLN